MIPRIRNVGILIGFGAVLFSCAPAPMEPVPWSRYRPGPYVNWATQKTDIDEGASATPTIAAEAEEYQVYNALLARLFFAPDADGRFAIVRRGQIEQLVLMNQTSLGPPPPTVASATLGFDHLQDELGTVPDDLLHVLLARNKIPARLEDHFTLPTSVTLLDEKEDRWLFDEMSEIGWDRFWYLYPHSQGVMVVSRVAFSRRGDVAVACAGSEQAGLHGVGYCAILNKRDNSWVIAKTATLWTS